jgi:hypothetical protein
VGFFKIFFKNKSLDLAELMGEGEFLEKTLDFGL